MIEKKCSMCGKWKVLSDFQKDKRQKFGRRPECKLCDKMQGSRILKSARCRVRCDELYKNMAVTITAKEIDTIANLCYFCNKKIVDKLVLHRPDSKVGYVKGNVVKAHKGCHRRYHALSQPRNGDGTFRKVGQ